MKVRRDFVTNSSSSSFLLSFKDKDSIYPTLRKQFPQEYSCGNGGYLSELLDEIYKAKTLTKDGIKLFIEQNKYCIKYDYLDELEEHMPYSEAFDYIETPEGQKEINKRCKEKIAKTLEKIGNNQITVRVKHGDGGEGEDGVLENEILPYLDCTVAEFSNH